MKKFTLLLAKATGALFATAPVFVLAFTVDIVAPSLTSAFYPAPNNDVEYTINAYYASGGTPPNDMIVPDLTGGNSLRIKILLPPGASQAYLRGESNNWIGTVGQQPVVGIISQDITGSCPTTTDNLVYSCMGTALQPVSGGLSKPLYTGTPLTSPKYVNFVLHNPANNFSLGTLSVAIQINDVAAYKTWRNARPWAGGASTNSVDGLTGTDSAGGTTTGGTTTGGTTTGGTTTGGTTTTPTGCPSGSALMPTISTDLTLTIPRLKFLPGGLGDMKVILKPVRDPNDPSQIVFELMSLGSPDFFFLPC